MRLVKNDLQRKSSLIIFTDVNMTAKRAFILKVNFYLIQPPNHEVLLIVVFGVFLSQ